MCVCVGAVCFWSRVCVCVHAGVRGCAWVCVCVCACLFFYGAALLCVLDKFMFA